MTTVMTSNLPPVIAAEDLQECRSWHLPDVSDGTRVLPAQIMKRRKLEELRAQAELQRQQEEQAARAAEPEAEASGELIEDVNAEELTFAPMTAEQLQEITEAAEKEGFDRGYGEGIAQGIAAGKKQGYADGLAQAQAEAQETLTQQVSHLMQLASALMEPIARQEQQLQQLLLQYVTTLTEQVIGRELQTDREQLLSAIRRALQALPVGAGKIKVIVNPQDLALIEAHAAEQEPAWLLAADPQLQPGGCRVETEESLVDFSVEARVKALLAEFLSQQLSIATPAADAVAAEQDIPQGDSDQHEPG